MSSPTSNDQWSDSDHQQIINALRPDAPKPLLISVERARDEAVAHAQGIFENWYTLQTVLERCEGAIRRRWVIRRRWAKKWQEQRKRIFLDTWSEIFSTHHPDYRAIEFQEPSEGAGWKQVPGCLPSPICQHLRSCPGKVSPIPPLKRTRSTRDVHYRRSQRGAYGIGDLSSS